VMGVCHLGHKADLDYLSMPRIFGGMYEPELMPYWSGDIGDDDDGDNDDDGARLGDGEIDGTKLRVWAMGTVRVMSSKTAEMASAACEKLRARARREAPESNIIAI